MLLYCFALLTPFVIAFEISHHLPDYPMDYNSSDDLIYAEERQPIAITNVEIEIDVVSIQNDLNDFLRLIPVEDVQNVVRNYYENDDDVKRAYTYLNGKDFMIVKDRILNILEVKNFLKYLNRTGLDVLNLMNTLTELMGDPDNFNQTLQSEKVAQNSTVTGGLHGLVDDILETLPQDQLLSQFFEKLETSDEFAKFVHNIGSEEFSHILEDMEALEQLNDEPLFYRRILFSDEVHFWLNTYVNKENCRIWADEQPEEYQELSLHPENCTVCCGLWAGGINGVYLFKNEDGCKVTIKYLQFEIQARNAGDI